MCSSDLGHAQRVPLERGQHSGVAAAVDENFDDYEGEDEFEGEEVQQPALGSDMDMTISNTTESMSDGFIYQVISSSNSKLYYLIIIDIITTYLFIMYRCHEDMYKPRVKVRHNDKTWDIRVYIR